MGFISDLAKGQKASFPGQDRGRALWREVFGTAKEDEKKPGKQPIPGGSWGRSITNSGPAVVRLLQAMRSMAPGGWSDDRYGQTSHFTGVSYVAIDRICKMLGQSEFQVFIKDENSPEGKRPVREDDAPQGDRQCRPYDLVKLLEKPNRQDSFGKTMYRWGQQLKLTGTALTWMVPNMLGTPMELYVVPTAIAIPQPAINPDYPDGYYRIQPVYPYGPFSSYPTPTTAVGAPIPAQWMLRFLLPHPLLRYEGYSPLTGLRLEIDEFEMIGKSRHYSMRKQINPSAVLNMDEVEGAEPWVEAEVDRVRAEFENAHQGPENAGNLFVAPPGGKLEQWGQRPLDMDYPSGWDQMMGFILGGGFGITKPAAGMVEDSSYSTLFATLKQLYLITLEPDCDSIASDLTRHLAPYFGDNLIVEIRCKRIDDHEITFQKVDKLVSLKGMPESVIKLVFKMLDIPIDQKVVEELSEAGQEEQGEMPGMSGQEGAMPGMDVPEEEGGLMELPEEEQEAERPDTGTLAEGALGPRMKSSRLNGYGKKSFYERCQEVLSNGHH